jgi:hypothetical protein
LDEPIGNIDLVGSHLERGISAAFLKCDVRFAMVLECGVSTPLWFLDQAAN